MKGYIILGAIFLLVSVGCSRTAKNEAELPKDFREQRIEKTFTETEVSKELVAEEVSFLTTDNFEIFSTYYAQEDNTPAIILLHMLDRNRDDWNDFALMLQNEGYTVLSIDLRGHGQSVFKNEEKFVWNDFSEQDFNNMVLDVEAAKNFLMEKADLSNLFVIGASIGANMALYYGSENDVKGIVLLSPGLEYRGVKTEEAMKNYKGPVLIVASNEDTYSATSANKLYSLAQGKKQIKVYDDAGHGTRMFAKTDLEVLIINWLKE